MQAGVNLGNWLVLEKWMDSDAFTGTDADDEVWLARSLSRDELRERMTIHRDAYITEADFGELAHNGVKLVRLPVPYFVFGDRAPFIGCIEYVDKAFEWAQKYDMQILLDLHTVPGSQNGFDNGGLSGVSRWWMNEKEVLFALSVLERLGLRYGTHPALYGIEVLNEPASWLVWQLNKRTYPPRDETESQGSCHVPMRFLKHFYKAAYTRLRCVMSDDKVIVFHDGFRLMTWVPVFMTPRFKRMKNIAIDTHIYITAMEGMIPQYLQKFIGTTQQCENVYRIFLKIIQLRLRVVRATGVDVMVGEWCLENQLSKRDESFTQSFAHMQLKTYNNAGVRAQFYWSYQQNQDNKKRVQLAHSWRKFWDWRMMKDYLGITL
ncbi:glycoside hydrolase family 5 protein [Alloscardovia venturai]|uniref:Glycoside hydrolase family 5 protein n=1 Tax=Alloscardovia venturai TaxID=1769421 RepID=A0ABW2Y921_9BIFI